jgi:arylsulfatase A-like enzyme
MPDKPNILLVTCHDLGHFLNCYGLRTVQTPNLDELARQGVRFAQSYAAAPQGASSRAAIATGRYPHSSGVMGLTHDDWGWDLAPDEKVLAQLLQDAGYHTVLASYQYESRRPTAQLGFEQELGFTGVAQDIGRSTAEWIRTKARRTGPFYLQLAFTECHRMVPASWFGHWPDSQRGVTVPEYLVADLPAKEEMALFQGAVHALDNAMGTVLAALDETSLADQTLVVFTTDNGIPFPRAKGSLYDAGIRTALIMRWPGGRWAGRGVARNLVSNVDLVPTVLDLADQTIPESVQGLSFAPVLWGRPHEPRAHVFAETNYHEYCDPARAVRSETHKLIVNFSRAPAFMDPTGCWQPRTTTRLPENPAVAYHEPVELYDLTKDPLEQENLARLPSAEEVRHELMDRLSSWMVETHDPLLEGLPTSPQYQMAMYALRTGEAVILPEEIP